LIISETKKTDVAEIISKVLHPYVIFPVVVMLIAYKGNPELVIWAKWTIIALLSAYFIPLLYMQIRVALVAHTTGVKIDSRSFFREQPNQMLLLAGLFGIPSALILFVIGSPSEIIATVVGVGLASLVIALVNRAYRASFHMAIFTSMVIPLVIVLGPSWWFISLFILLLGLSRYYLGKHTPMQLTVGFLLGVVVSVDVFYMFGLI